MWHVYALQTILDRYENKLYFQQEYKSKLMHVASMYVCL